jgi:hypothetical protein
VLAGLPLEATAGADPAPGEVAAPSGTNGSRPLIHVPRVARPPAIEDFLSRELDGGFGGTLTKATDFVQRDNHDGEPATRRTDAYLGYDDEHLYVVFVAHDDPALVRGNLARRDEAYVDGNDDQVALFLDTFNDRRRAYYFSVNPEGVQFDSLFVEGQAPPGDSTFDLVWHAEPRRTDWGYILRLAIPFKSLRFSPEPRQEWGIILERWTGRDREWALWPKVSTKVEGILTQAGSLTGLENVSPARNLRLIPYATFRAFRGLDAEDPGQADFVTEGADPDAGLDAKMVFNDSLVLDLTANPEFSQVESDEPQVTVNQRFEVLFPEKRPFFLENAGYFRTPMQLLFTRRIADPRAGLRVTGKAGPWALGFLAADDEAPGKLLPPDDPLEGESARFGVARLSRDVLEHSSVGLIFTDRELQDSFNRVGGVDARLRFNDRWAATLQAVTSSTRDLDGERLAGPAYDLQIDRAGRHFTWAFDYNDVSPGFRSEPGFVRRVDIRRAFQRSAYRFRPDGRRVLWYGPVFEAEGV